MNSFVIKKAAIEDITETENIYNEATDWQLEKGIHQWRRGVYPTRKVAEDAFKSGYLYSGFLDGRLVATFILNEIQSKEYQTVNWNYGGEKGLVIHTFIVKPNVTGIGIGHRLLNYILDKAKAEGYDYIRLDTYSGNFVAIHLYESVGFEFVGNVVFDFKDPGHKLYNCYELKIK